MYREDYIVRMIRQYVVFIQKLMQKTADKYERIEELERQYYQLLGVSGRFVSELSAEDLVKLLVS